MANRAGGWGVRNRGRFGEGIGVRRKVLGADGKVRGVGDKGMQHVIGVQDILGEGKVRLLTSFHVKRWFLHTKDPQRDAVRYLRRLEDKGFVDVSEAMLCDIDVTEPLYTWPSDLPPNFSALSWKGRSRTQNGTPKKVLVATPGKKLVGTRVRISRATELQHDALVSSIFLNHLEESDENFSRWTLEDDLYEMFLGKTHVPDAILESDAKEITYIECVGRYPKEKLISMHESFCHGAYKFF